MPEGAPHALRVVCLRAVLDRRNGGALAVNQDETRCGTCRAPRDGADRARVTARLARVALCFRGSLFPRTPDTPGCRRRLYTPGRCFRGHTRSRWSSSGRGDTAGTWSVGARLTDVQTGKAVCT